MQKRISLKEWTYIGKYNCAAKWLRPFCSYTLSKEPNGCFRRRQQVGWFMYLILFIPVHVLQLLWCTWDGGLKEFELNKPYLGSDVIFSDCECYNRAKEVWDSK